MPRQFGLNFDCLMSSANCMRLDQQDWFCHATLIDLQFYVIYFFFARRKSQLISSVLFAGIYLYYVFIIIFFIYYTVRIDAIIMLICCRSVAPPNCPVIMAQGVPPEDDGWCWTREVGRDSRY